MTHLMELVGANKTSQTRRYLLTAMELTADPHPFTKQYVRQHPIRRLRRRGALVINTIGIDIAKRGASGHWYVRTDYVHQVNVQARTAEVEYVLQLCGFVKSHIDPRTRWAVWVPAC